MARWGKKQARFKRKQINEALELCDGKHMYSPLDFVYREGKFIVCKVCENCTHVLYKDEWLAMVIPKQARIREMHKTDHINFTGY